MQHGYSYKILTNTREMIMVHIESYDNIAKVYDGNNLKINIFSMMRQQMTSLTNTILTPEIANKENPMETCNVIESKHRKHKRGSKER